MYTSPFYYVQFYFPSIPHWVTVSFILLQLPTPKLDNFTIIYMLLMGSPPPTSFLRYSFLFQKSSLYYESRWKIFLCDVTSYFYTSSPSFLFYPRKLYSFFPSMFFASRKTKETLTTKLFYGH